ncbi:hypothetical protein PSPO01_15868 [Paraphaeosphaeria sporulosa]
MKHRKKGKPRGLQQRQEYHGGARSSGPQARLGRRVYVNL